jgi:hypothetical protein
MDALLSVLVGGVMLLAVLVDLSALISVGLNYSHRGRWRFWSTPHGMPSADTPGCRGRAESVRPNWMPAGGVGCRHRGADRKLMLSGTLCCSGALQTRRASPPASLRAVQSFWVGCVALGHTSRYRDNRPGIHDRKIGTGIGTGRLGKGRYNEGCRPAPEFAKALKIKAKRYKRGKGGTSASALANRRLQPLGHVSGARNP